MLRRHAVEQKSDIIIAAPSLSASKGLMKDHEGLIPVPSQHEFSFVVDCPFLHIIDGNDIGSRRPSETDEGLSMFDHATCPKCQHVITRTRQVATPKLGLANRVGSNEEFWPLQPSIPPLPEVVPIHIDPPGRGGSISTPEVKSKGLGFFWHHAKRQGSVPSKTDIATQKEKSPRTAKSIPSLKNAGGTLPSQLSFCFSLSGNNLILWKKDSLALVRIEIESRGSRLLDLTDMLPASNESRAVNIRHVAEGSDWICAIISHNRQLILLVLHCSGLPEESRAHFINEQVDHRALAISPDNAFIAVGFGTRIHLYNYQGCHQQWHTILSVPDFTIPAEVKFQVMSFSSDSTTLVVATQRYDVFRSAEDDNITTYVWDCIAQPPPPQKMSLCKMPTDGQGLTSIYHSPTLSLSLILGASPTPYPLFLLPCPSPSSRSPSPVAGPALIPPPPTMTEFRIRSAALSPPPNSHLAYMLDFRDRLYCIDMRARSVACIADLHLERGQLAVREEVAAVGVTAEGVVRVFWRRGSGLWVCTVNGQGKKEVVNFRGLWEDAGGGG